MLRLLVLTFRGGKVKLWGKIDVGGNVYSHQLHCPDARQSLSIIDLIQVYPVGAELVIDLVAVTVESWPDSEIPEVITSRKWRAPNILLGFITLELVYSVRLSIVLNRICVQQRVAIPSFPTWGESFSFVVRGKCMSSLEYRRRPGQKSSSPSCTSDASRGQYLLKMTFMIWLVMLSSSQEVRFSFFANQSIHCLRCLQL